MRSTLAVREILELVEGARQVIVTAAKLQSDLLQLGSTTNSKRLGGPRADEKTNTHAEQESNSTERQRDRRLLHRRIIHPERRRGESLLCKTHSTFIVWPVACPLYD